MKAGVFAEMLDAQSNAGLNKMAGQMNGYLPVTVGW